MDDEVPISRDSQQPVFVRVSHNRIIHQSHESETLIIDLLSGCYYCLEGSAPAIWKAVIDGSTPEQITNKLALLHESRSLSDLRPVVANFLQKLKQEELVTIEGEDSANLISMDTGAKLNTVKDPAEAIMTKFSDLADLLLADPIHEI